MAHDGERLEKTLGASLSLNSPPHFTFQELTIPRANHCNSRPAQLSALLSTNLLQSTESSLPFASTSDGSSSLIDNSQFPTSRSTSIQRRLDDRAPTLLSFRFRLRPAPHFCPEASTPAVLRGATVRRHTRPRRRSEERTDGQTMQLH